MLGIGAAFMNGMRRGLFSNEAAQGSAPATRRSPDDLQRARKLS